VLVSAILGRGTPEEPDATGTHDLTRVRSRERCPCGRTHLRLDRLSGRTDDMVIFRGTNFYPQQVESLILKQLECPELTVLKEGELPRPPGKSVRVVNRR
jgi:hypothetical protein